MKNEIVDIEKIKKELSTLTSEQRNELLNLEIAEKYKDLVDLNDFDDENMLIKPFLKTEMFVNRLKLIATNFDNIVLSYSGGKDSQLVLELLERASSEADLAPERVTIFSAFTSYRDHFHDQFVQEQLKKAAENGFNIVQDRRHYLMGTSHHNVERGKFISGSGEIEVFDAKTKSWNNIKDNTMFPGMRKMMHDLQNKVLFKMGGKTAHLQGLRSRESLQRMNATLRRRINNWTAPDGRQIFWSTKNTNDEKNYTFYPIFDFGEGETWRTIKEYAKTYDLMWQFGVHPKNLRTGNILVGLSKLDFYRQTSPDVVEEILRIEPSFEKHLNKKFTRVLSEDAKVRDYFIQNTEEKW